MAKDPKRNKNRETKTVCKAVIKKINTVKEKERNARQEAENARLAQLNAPRELTRGMKQTTTDPVTEVYDSITKLKEWRRSLLSPVNQSKDLGSGCSSTDLASSPNELDNNSPCGDEKKETISKEPDYGTMAWVPPPPAGPCPTKNKCSLLQTPASGKTNAVPFEPTADQTMSDLMLTAPPPSSGPRPSNLDNDGIMVFADKTNKGSSRKRPADILKGSNRDK